MIAHKCGYCGKEKPESEMRQYKAMHYVTQRHLDRLDWYCKDVRPNDTVDCATAMQFSLEG